MIYIVSLVLKTNTMNKEVVHKPANVTDPWTKLEMELELRRMKTTDRVRDVMNPDEFKNFKKEMNKRGYE